MKRRSKRSHSKFYAKSRELKKVAEDSLTKKVKQLSHRFLRKALKKELKRELEEWERD